MRIVVLGAGGQLGREVIVAGLKRGHKFGAVVRRPPDPPFDNAVEVRRADARNEQEIRSALSGFDAVVNVIGGGTLRRNDVASSASAVVVPAVQAAGIRRYIAMSAGMVALDWPLFKYVLRPLIFRHILAEHRHIEEIVRASALDWTIVRPSALTNRPPTGYAASLELQRRSFVTARGDVAAFIADELEGGKYIRKAVFIASQGRE
jgi:putative NADH-flavin reductase